MNSQPETNADQVASVRSFEQRHIGLEAADQQQMLKSLGYTDLDTFIADVVPAAIASNEKLECGEPASEREALAALQGIAKQNQVFRSLIGQGYYGTITPAVIARNVLENPAWYTAYTPYQPEISQGRLEALLNYQTMVAELTGLDIANASMLDEGTAAAEAMALARRTGKSKGTKFFVDSDCLPQTLAVLQTRADAAGYELCIGDPQTDFKAEECFGLLLQYPGASGRVADFSELVATAQAAKNVVVMAADILALTLLKSPGELGADVAVGSTQRFGVPMGFGGPHAAYMATRARFQRSLPGRLVGLSIDSHGDPAYRLALQTREQHIRREKATSNICTAQVLLAVIASMYACYHGPDGLQAIALRIHNLAVKLARGLVEQGYSIRSEIFFDTVTVETGADTDALLLGAAQQGINLRLIDAKSVGISLDELSDVEEVNRLLAVFADAGGKSKAKSMATIEPLPLSLRRMDRGLQHPVFSRYRTETEMLRYLRRLADKDLALDRTMIPLGSCTMKLNATSEMMPISWPEFSDIHPLAPSSQIRGYQQMIAELENQLVACTGYDAVSLQPNAGSQGEFAGLLAIAAYHESRGEGQRNVCLIPGSAHGTNPASAQMCSMQIVVVDCDAGGNIDLADLRAKAEQHADKLAAIMVTYPSTHGVFEEDITDVTAIVHEFGGQVYVDGANLNAMLGLTAPALFGGDVSHLNLHKTFCIPHGGGGPGVGPVAARAHLAPFLPAMASIDDSEEDRRQRPVVSSAAYGSASILPISWMYIHMMGGEGLTRASKAAILAANYVANVLAPHFPILYSGHKGLVAHECILDLRPLKEETGIAVEDVAKRLIDYGFHAPTMSFPVAGTLMIEPTESESLQELDRFCAAMIQIRNEISRIAAGEWPLEDNPLVNAPHTAEQLVKNEWAHAYSREDAAYPLASLRSDKYWSPVGRVDNVHGDRNLVCSCPSIDDYRE